MLRDAHQFICWKNSAIRQEGRYFLLVKLIFIWDKSTGFFIPIKSDALTLIAEKVRNSLEHIGRDKTFLNIAISTGSKINN